MVKATVQSSWQHKRFLLSVFILLISSTALKATDLWSNPATWPGGVVPQGGQQVTIPPGRTIILDVNPPALSGLRIRGTLRFAEVPLHLTTDWIMVMMGGVLEIGTASAPHFNTARITLTGADVDVMGLGMGGKFLSVMDGGTLELHGASRDELSWSVLDGTVLPGATSLTMVENSTWSAGDKIVLAPSGVNPLEAEELTVVYSVGRTVTFTPALQHKHFGEIQMVDGKELDMRAEVGLLTRNILIEGDEASLTNSFGGHLMIMNGGNGYIEGVEFFRMGQFTKQGRYPCHWHLSGQRYDNYARYNSVHHSFHRAMVIHGTDGVTLQGNVAYDIRSHAFVIAEDGDEEDNIILNNLGMLVRQIIRQEDYAFINYTFVGSSSQSESRPGVFWMKNPNQIIQGNHAAGSVDGIGFFYDGLGTATSIRPDFFQDNVAHSNYSFFTVTVNERYPPLSRGHGLFIRTESLPGKTFTFEGLTAYKNSVSGVWLEEYGQVANNAMLADNGSGAMLMRAALTNSTVIYQSNNTQSPPAKRYGAFNTIPQFGKKKDHLLENVNFYGFPDAIYSYDDSLAGPNVVARNVGIFGSTGPRVTMKTKSIMEGAIRDEDGSLTGTGQPTLIFHDSYGFKNLSCNTDEANSTTMCPMDEYAFVRIFSEYGAARPVGEIEVTRVGGAQRSMFFTYESPEIYEQYQYLPLNTRHRINFVAPPLGLLPGLFYVEANGIAEGYVALRIPLDPGNGAYLLDEYDNFVPSVSSTRELRLDQTNYYLDAVRNTLYVIMHMNEANGFRQKLSLLQVPAAAFLRGETAIEPVLYATATPNVVQDATKFRFYLPEAGLTHLRMFDAMGRAVREWTPGELAAGSHEIDASLLDLPNGAYIFRLEAGSYSSTGKLTVLH
ncbi:MAG: hypothetical protein GC205_09530 [Bacteroidetes bacterium]|nr:hypothetical protein [Bacteroidota bacterium]